MGGTGTGEGSGTNCCHLEKAVSEQSELFRLTLGPGDFHVKKIHG